MGDKVHVRVCVCEKVSVCEYSSYSCSCVTVLFFFPVLVIIYLKHYLYSCTRVVV
jgi:hypothetical protein